MEYSINLQFDSIYIMHSVLNIILHLLCLGRVKENVYANQALRNIHKIRNVIITCCHHYVRII